MASFAWILSLGVGFLSLSQEILWVRLVSFTTRGLSQSFALVLFLFLIGIAVGSAIGKRLCERQHDLLRTSAIVLGLAAVVDLSLLGLLPVIVQWQSGASVFALIVVTALLKSIMFPIAHHLGSQQSGARIGRSVSKVYFGNIVGSTLGPIVTGYILLDRLTMDQCLLLIGLATGLLSLSCAMRARALRIGLAAALVIVPAAVLAWPGPLSLAGAIAAADKTLKPGARISHVVENRSGIIHTIAEPNGSSEAVMGGNVYDGRIAVDMDANQNALDRALVLLALHPNPENVVVVGLSTGAWARILSASPRIKHMTVVEINPGYLQLIAQYPQVAPVLSDPRIEIVVDDGRRWLRRHPQARFDLFVQNTTFSWRAYSTNLLSREYMQLAGAHLKPGGIVALNSTDSSDVLKTATEVFPFVERRSNFIYGSFSDISRPLPNAEAAYHELRLDDKLVFGDAAFREGGLVRNMIGAPFVPHAHQYDGMSEAPTAVSDQNLVVEHAHARMRGSFPAFYRQVDAVRSLLHRDH
ncbi:Spermidine synthase [Variovorax sp. PBL-H6]|uniref:spermine/spermidine synthase domain-containing protein n=1 Tax=Variovorax sp. PBL-H6 TaxID=434009 RepID=UPI00131767A2|nr:hypothetical protein [Variovorax sp. PBL-H6]VTU14993.1 Spermidine synthase [Variovorax sp. PBL-H6]